MNIIALERGRGKTTELIRISSNTGYPIVCMNSCRDHIKRMARDLGLHIPEPICASDLKHRKQDLFCGLRNKILIDDAECLASIFDVYFVISNGICSLPELYGYDVEVDTITVSIKEDNLYEKYL